MLTPSDASDAVARYEGHLAAFEHVATGVMATLRTTLRPTGLKHVLSGRAKSPDSLRNKLMRKDSPYDPWDFEGDPRAWQTVCDLAAVRVMVYDHAAATVASKLVATVFGVHAEQKEKPFLGTLVGYRATHFSVRCRGWNDHASLGLTPEELDLPCEVQVCVLTDHVWNELEHDIRYKQPDGTPDDAQVELLIALRRELDLVGGTIVRLMERTEIRRVENSERLTAPHELRRYFEERDRCTLDEDFSALFDLLQGVVAELTSRWLDNERAKCPIDLQRAREIAERHDHYQNFGAVGRYAVQLLPVITKATLLIVLDAPRPVPPLLRFLKQVAEGEELG